MIRREFRATKKATRDRFGKGKIYLCYTLADLWQSGKLQLGRSDSGDSIEDLGEMLQNPCSSCRPSDYISPLRC
jgi:hypothetical protein